MTEVELLEGIQVAGESVGFQPPRGEGEFVRVAVLDGPGVLQAGAVCVGPAREVEVCVPVQPARTTVCWLGGWLWRTVLNGCEVPSV